MRIAISTGGGDAPGLNAVIRTAVLGALQSSWAEACGTIGSMTESTIDITATTAAMPAISMRRLPDATTVPRRRNIATSIATLPSSPFPCPPRLL